MTTIPRTGFVRVGERIRIPKLRKAQACSTGKQRHRSEAGALDALVRVRERRRVEPDGRLAESRIYPCPKCGGWHLTSQEPNVNDLTPVRERGAGETWQSYARRLERRIAEQRAQLVSLHAVGHGAASNRATRQRIAALVVALGEMTERWEHERRNREALVARLDELRARRSPLHRLFSLFNRNAGPVRPRP